MELSPLTGVPIAGPDDFATDYPVEVDDPRTRGLEKFTIPRFANVAERDAAYALAPPSDGSTCIVVGDYREYQYFAGNWVPTGKRSSNNMNIMIQQYGGLALIAGLVNISTNSAGDGNFNFGNGEFAFDNACIGVLLHQQDANLGQVMAITHTNMVYPYGCHVRVRWADSNNPVGDAGVWFNYIAIGY